MPPAKKAWQPSTLAEAKRNAVVNFVSSTGTKWTVRKLTLDELAAEDGLPDDLLKIVLLEMIPGGVVNEIAGKISEGDQDAAAKLAQDTVRLRNRVAVRAAVAPALTEADLADLDATDLEEIAAVAQRRLDADEEGRLIPGLATFRGADQDA